MTCISIPLTLTTPLFLGGADPGVPEIRPPSIRGALRYWLRVGLAGQLGDDQQALTSLHLAETDVFGSAAEENSGCASSIQVRVRDDQTKQSDATWQRTGRIRHVSKPTKKDRVQAPFGRDYLYWSMSPNKEGTGGRKYLQPGGHWTLCLADSPRVIGRDQSVLQQALAAAWLMVHLGGLGARVRRTAGSLSVYTACDAFGLSFLMPRLADGPQGTHQAASFLSQNLNRIREICSNVSNRPGTFQSPISEWDALTPSCARVWVLGVWTKWEDAVDEIGNHLSDSRTYIDPDYHSVLNWLNNTGTPSTLSRAIYGLPIIWRYTGTRTSGTIQGALRVKPRAHDDDEHHERRASPLWLHVTRTAGNQYVGVGTLFKSRFLPANAGLEIKDRELPRIDSPANYSLIENWMSDFQNVAEARYV